MKILQVADLKRPVPVYVYPSQGRITTIQDIDFKVRIVYGGVKGWSTITVQSGYRSDMASVPVWYVALTLAVLASGIPWLLGIGNEMVAGLQVAVIVFLALCLTLRKFAMFPAGILHDALYDGKYDVEGQIGAQMDRKACDDIFYLLVSGYCLNRLPGPLRWLPARIAWLGVRLFGRTRYRAADG